MEPKICPKPFDDEDFAFQIKWDGTRILAHIGETGAQLFNRKNNRRTAQYPEVVEALSDLAPQGTIFDGEMIALNGGVPDFRHVMRRDRSTDITTISHLRRIIPVTYVIFDMLLAMGEDLTTNPFHERDEMLKFLLRTQDPVVITDTFRENGTGLFEVTKNRDLEGIVAKKWDSPYILGKKSDYWLKIKHRRHLVGIAGGYSEEGCTVRSLYLGLYEGNDLIFVGKASSGITEDTARDLHRRLEPLKIPDCPFSPAVSPGKEKVYWVKPHVEIPVEYMEFTEQGIMRHPVIKLP